MIILFARRRLLWSVGLCIALVGCVQPASNSSDEEKEPYFQHGQELANSLDDKGAAEAFEKALEVNPHNAQAHFRLGLLCQRGDSPDLAAAIYHFERFLQMRGPDSAQADSVRASINACKQDFARSVSASLNPVAQAMQRDLEQATADRTRLTTENRDLQRQVAALKVERAQLSAAALQASPPQPAASQDPALSSRRSAAPSSNYAASTRSSAGLGMRTHIAQPRETFVAIARKYGVSLEALIASNPRIEPRKLRAGQAVMVPPN